MRKKVVDNTPLARGVITHLLFCLMLGFVTTGSIFFIDTADFGSYMLIFTLTSFFLVKEMILTSNIFKEFLFALKKPTNTSKGILGLVFLFGLFLIVVSPVIGGLLAICVVAALQLNEMIIWQ